MSSEERSIPDSDYINFEKQVVQNGLEENLFGLMHFKLNYKIKIGSIILPHYRCKSECYKLIEYDSILIEPLQKRKFDLFEKLNKSEAIAFDIQIIASKQYEKQKNSKVIREKPLKIGQPAKMPSLFENQLNQVLQQNTFHFDGIAIECNILQKKVDFKQQ